MHSTAMYWMRLLALTMSTLSTTCHVATVYLHAGCAEAVLQPTLDQLAALTSQLQQVALETNSRTRAASSINVQDLQRFRVVADVEVNGVASNARYNILKKKVPKADGFVW